MCIGLISHNFYVWLVIHTAFLLPYILFCNSFHIGRLNRIYNIYSITVTTATANIVTITPTTTTTSLSVLLTSSTSV